MTILFIPFIPSNERRGEETWMKTRIGQGMIFAICYVSVAPASISFVAGLAMQKQRSGLGACIQVDAGQRSVIDPANGLRHDQFRVDVTGNVQVQAAAVCFGPGHEM